MLAVATALDVKDLDLRAASMLIKQTATDQPIEIDNAAHLHGLLAGLKTGEYIINGDAGDYLGVLNDGARIRVLGNVGNYVGDNMTRGLIEIAGDAGYGAGLYPYGGTLVVRGNAGDFTATMNKGATIIVCGDVGDECGTYHLAGDLIVVGNAGANLGNYLIRGTIYLGGECESLGHNTVLQDVTQEDVLKLLHYFEQYEIVAKPARATPDGHGAPGFADLQHFKKLVAKSQKPFYE
jgi:glutamate synthase domain-containing protein 3